MRSKLEGHAYHSVADLEADFNLMVSNCLIYNAKDTVFHRTALRLRDLGGAILRHAQRQATNTGLDLDTGMHLPQSPKKRDFYSCTWDDGEFKHLFSVVRFYSLQLKKDIFGRRLWLRPSCLALIFNRSTVFNGHF